MATESFGRQLRLTSQAEYKQVFAEACRVTDPLITILARDNGLDRPRLGLALSKKQVRKASDRNRIKRQARESFRRRREALTGLDIIVMVRAGIEKVDRRRVWDAFDRLWQKVDDRCRKS